MIAIIGNRTSLDTAFVGDGALRTKEVNSDTVVSSLSIIENTLENIDIAGKILLKKFNDYTTTQSASPLWNPDLNKSCVITDISVSTSDDVIIEIFFDGVGNRIRKWFLLANMSIEANFSKPMKGPPNGVIKVNTDGAKTCTITIHGYEEL